MLTAPADLVEDYQIATRQAKEERDQAVAAHAAAVEQAAKDAAEARRQYGVLQGLLRDATTEREVLRTERNQARRNFDGQVELAQGLQRQLDALREAAWVLIRQLHALAGAATDADDVLKANLTGGVHSAEAAEVVAALRALARDPLQRYASAQTFRDDLAQWSGASADGATIAKITKEKLNA